MPATTNTPLLLDWRLSEMEGHYDASHVDTQSHQHQHDRECPHKAHGDRGVPEKHLSVPQEW